MTDNSLAITNGYEIEAIRGLCWVPRESSYLWLLGEFKSSSNYTPGRVTGKANSLLRMVPHAWLYSHLMDTLHGTTTNVTRDLMWAFALCRYRSGFNHIPSLTTAGSLQTKPRATCWTMKPLPV